MCILDLMGQQNSERSDLLKQEKEKLQRERKKEEMRRRIRFRIRRIRDFRNFVLVITKNSKALLFLLFLTHHFILYGLSCTNALFLFLSFFLFCLLQVSLLTYDILPSIFNSLLLSISVKRCFQRPSTS